MIHAEVQEHVTQHTHNPITAARLPNKAKVKHAKDMRPICVRPTRLVTTTAAMLNEHSEWMVRAPGKWQFANAPSSCLTEVARLRTIVMAKRNPCLEPLYLLTAVIQHALDRLPRDIMTSAIAAAGIWIHTTSWTLSQIRRMAVFPPMGNSNPSRSD